MKEIKFVKAVASGNDFVIVDRLRAPNDLAQGRQGTQRPRSGQAENRVQISKMAKEFCQRKLSVGADGLLLLEPSKKADFKMRIFNPDGTEVDMCGNGARCVALYAVKKGICRAKMTIETAAGNLQAQVKQEAVKVKMPDCQDLKLEFDLNADGEDYKVNYANTGVPHVVTFVSNLADFPVEELGKAIRYHSEFQPEGANANFVEMRHKAHIRVRTYERGVEQETSACGTGCVAAGIVTTYKMKDQPQGTYRIKVDTQSGETLNVYFQVQEGTISQVYLEGKTKIVYTGGINV